MKHLRISATLTAWYLYLGLSTIVISGAPSAKLDGGCAVVTSEALGEATGCVADASRSERRAATADGTADEETKVAEGASSCVDDNKRCGQYADGGECQNNPSWMLVNCKKSCGVCDSEEAEPRPCVDDHVACGGWAARGECQANPVYMLGNCRKSCGACRPEESAESRCADGSKQCKEWAKKGECNANASWMLRNCRRSCGVCVPEKSVAPPCADDHERCTEWATAGGCDTNPSWMLQHCKKSCWECAPDILDIGVNQTVLSTSAAETEEIIRRTEKYIRSEVFAKPELRTVRKECKNRNTYCSYYAAIGECEKKSGWMSLNCAPACQVCQNLKYDTRCAGTNFNVTDSIKPGEMDSVFERLVKDGGSERTVYNATVLSRPSDAGDISPDHTDHKNGPWVVTIHDFLTPKECDRLIELGAMEGYKRSVDVGKMKFDGTYEPRRSEFRTSENAWCQYKCYEDPVAQHIMEKIADLTGIPEENFEYLQLLRYAKNQFYRAHHDFIPHHINRPQRPRILTLYLYLNDVEAGGGTNFPLLNLTVMPKQGMALLWPNVLNQDLTLKDSRTEHQALPVEQGTKYGANAWIHLRDFKSPLAASCN